MCMERTRLAEAEVRSTALLEAGGVGGGPHTEGAEAPSLTEMGVGRV